MFQFKFSIITVVKNDEINLEKTIKSIIKQRELNDVEYIVIDGKSNDRTVEIINKYKEHIDIFISEPDKGIYAAMNKGINLSTGDIIGICNSGDTLLPKGLSYISNQFKKNFDFVFGTVLRKYLGSEILKYGFNLNRIDYNFDFATSHSTGFYIRRNILNEIGLYDTQFKCSADYDYYFRIVKSKKFKGSSTQKKELVGVVESGGFSSKISFFGHLNEETKIRMKNNQNIILIILIYLNALIKYILKKF